MTVSKQMKRIYVLRDTLRDNETVFEGDAKACAKFCHTSMQNVGQCFKRGGKLNRRYAIEIVRLVHIELTHQYRGGSQKFRQSIIDAITMQDVDKIRNSYSFEFLSCILCADFGYDSITNISVRSASIRIMQVPVILAFN